MKAEKLEKYSHDLDFRSADNEFGKYTVSLLYNSLLFHK